METAATVEETARIDADGSIVETHGECKQGIGLSYNGIWGYHPSADRQFLDEWDSGPQFGTPLYLHLDRFPARSARVVAAIGTANEGAVLFHCQGGRDRAGLIAMLVLRWLVWSRS